MASSAKEDIENFYKSKKKYDNAYNTAKNRILHNTDLSNEEKREAIKNIKPKCIGCKRSVGMVFTPSIGRVKEAKCGDTTSPCKYHIKIDYGVFNYAPDLLEEVKHDMRICQLEINKIKYNLLFGLVTEEEMVESFQTMKDKYRQLVVSRNTVEDFMNKYNIMQVQGVGLEVEDIERKKYAQLKQNELASLISDFRRIINDFSSDDSADSKRAKMNDAIDLYNTRIIPILKILRETLYEISTVLKSRGQYKLIQKYRSLQSLVMEIEPLDFDGEVGERLAAFDENFRAVMPEEKTSSLKVLDDDDEDDEDDEEDPWLTMDED